MDGWIKLHRKITESAIFSDPDLLRLWIFCLAKAAYKEKTVMIEKQEINLQPGQFVTGRFALHDEYNRGVAPRKKIKETTLWSWLKRLETFGNLDIKSFNKYSVVSIVKWSEYQETLTTELQQTDNRLTTEPQQTDTNKNLKNLEKGEEETYKDNDGPDVFRILYQEGFGIATPVMAERVGDLIDEHGDVWVVDAIKEASFRGKKSLPYVSTILSSWKLNGRDAGKEYKHNAEPKGNYEKGIQSGRVAKESEFAFLDRQIRTGTQG